MKVKSAGISDEQVVEYTWTKNKASWTLISAGQLKAQDASYTLTPDGDKTKVRFDITIDLSIPMPGFVLKRVMKGATRNRHRRAAQAGAEGQESEIGRSSSSGSAIVSTASTMYGSACSCSSSRRRVCATRDST